MHEDEDLPDWLREVQTEEADRPLFEGEALPVDELTTEEPLPDWLSEADAEEEAETFEEAAPVAAEPAEEELPDWLQEVQTETPEPEMEAVAGFAPVVMSQEAEVGLIDEEGLPDWLQDIEEEEEVDLTKAQEEVMPPPAPEPVAPSRPEPAPEKIEPAAPVQPRLTEVERPIERPAVPEPVVAASRPVSGAIPDWLKKLRESEEITTQAEQPQPLPQAVPAPAPVSPPIFAATPPPAPAPVPPKVDISTLPADAGKRLEMAKLAREKGEIDRALPIYETLVLSGVHLDRVIDDLQQSAKLYPSNYQLYQLMGDAMMRDGRLQGALEAYREAMLKLAT
jgi:hypothetical protein